MEKHINCDKMIIAVLQGDDYRVAIENLNSKGFYATVLHSTGGFLKKKSVTLMIGVNHDHLEEALGILRQYGDRIEMQYRSTAAFGNGGIPGIALSSVPPQYKFLSTAETSYCLLWMCSKMSAADKSFIHSLKKFGIV